MLVYFGDCLYTLYTCLFWGLFIHTVYWFLKISIIGLFGGLFVHTVYWFIKIDIIGLFLGLFVHTVYWFIKIDIKVYLGDY